jgi:NAD(P)-dependent dehydrogenase (short-subunit alcohol dehydrogenase family)
MNIKNYLIIGASSGIGKSLATVLVKEGHNVIGTYFKTSFKSEDSNLKIHPLDVNEEHLALDFLPETLDGVIYCPGSINLKPFHRIKPEEFLEDYKFQVVGAVKILQACLPALKKSSAASVILFSTVAVQLGFNFHSLVASSKGAIEGLTHALSAELSPKIRVNCIAPSVTDTPLAAGILGSEEKKELNAQRHPLQRVGEAIDIAEMAAFLLSSKAGWISGQVFHVDGGLSSIKK